MLQMPINSIKIADPGYPNSLKSTNRPPDLLYYIGALHGNSLSIGIVGSRKMSDYGRQVLAKVIPGLQGLDICIVSGLAFGVDAEAHRLALENGLKTIAVLGCAIDDIQPNINRPLAQQIIASGGAIISEYAPGSAIYKSNFSDRNRIIAGMSQATVVIEADAKSGALITARYAHQYGRKVFAVPGSIFHDLSKGTNALLKKHAAAVTSADDVIKYLAELHPQLLQAKAGKTKPLQAVENISGLNPEEQLIYKLIRREATSFEEISAKAKMPVQQMNAALSMLEIKNKIRKLDGNRYCRNLAVR
jgi:DNA processing protein